MYDACIRSVLLYGSENWALTRRLEQVITSCDRRMLRHMAGVSLRDRVTSEEVAGRCGLQQICAALRRRRLRWFGHVYRMEEGEVLAEVRDIEVEGGRPRGRLKNTWRDTVRDDMRELGIREDLARDRDEWRRAIDRLTSHGGNI